MKSERFWDGIGAARDVSPGFGASIVGCSGAGRGSIRKLQRNFAGAIEDWTQGVEPAPERARAELERLLEELRAYSR